MQALFLSEAAKYQVLPLDNSILPRLLTPRPSATAGRTMFTYSGENANIPVGNAPSILNRDYSITAEVTIPKSGAEGMIATMGGRFAGYALYLLKGKPVFVYNLAQPEAVPLGGRRGRRGLAGSIRSSPVSTRLCSTSNTTVPALARAAPACYRSMAGSCPGRRSSTRFPSSCPSTRSFDIGIDTRTGVDDSYKLPFRFTGTINKLTYNLRPEQLTAEEREIMKKGAGQRARLGASGMLKGLLTFAAIAEVGTGLVLMIDPAIVVALLLGIDISGAGTLVGRCFGIALLALGLACWPSGRVAARDAPAVWAMLIYNALIALYLAYLGTVGHLFGVLLWPAVALHALVALLLVVARPNERHADATVR